MRLFIYLFFCTILAANSANATIVTFSFEATRAGEGFGRPGTLLESLRDVDVLTGNFSLNIDAVDQDPNPNRARFLQDTLELSISFDQAPVPESFVDAVDFQLVNDPTGLGVDFIFFNAQPFGFTGESISFQSFAFGDQIDSGDLTAESILAIFSSGQSAITVNDFNGGFAPLRFVFSSFQLVNATEIPIPLPALLFLTGLSVLNISRGNGRRGF